MWYVLFHPNIIIIFNPFKAFFVQNFLFLYWFLQRRNYLKRGEKIPLIGWKHFCTDSHV